MKTDRNLQKVNRFVCQNFSISSLAQQARTKTPGTMYVFALSIRFKVAIISVARAKGEDNILAVYGTYLMWCVRCTDDMLSRSCQVNEISNLRTIVAHRYTSSPVAQASRTLCAGGGWTGGSCKREICVWSFDSDFSFFFLLDKPRMGKIIDTNKQRKQFYSCTIIGIKIGSCIILHFKLCNGGRKNFRSRDKIRSKSDQM